MKSIQQEAIQFIYLVKQTFINQPSKYGEFAKLISSSPKLQEDHSQLISKLENLFADDHDLLSGLNDFLPKSTENSTVNFQHDDKDDDDNMTEEDQPPKKKQCRGVHTWFSRDSGSELFDKIRDRCVEKNDDEFRVLMKFAEAILSYHDKKITFDQVDLIFKSLFQDDLDLYVEVTRVLAQSLQKKCCEKTDLLRKGEKESGKAVLYEETMDVKEFYMFEMDMAFSRLESTIKKLDKDPESFEESFTVFDVKCIKKLYDNDGLSEEMIRILQSDPVGRVVARVVVLDRLRQKKKQLEEQKFHLDKKWNEIFEDIREKGRICRHRDFLQRTKKASINGYGEKS